ncbi:ABC transporter permease [Hymenobacter arizonensis]|uniref:Peptide/nickel transport system permease protein n=1 Tax=Hymenobacter arizonensis TaxID=1227077 RepID=A0A1I5WGW1_HYMAR|nr:ABC transporter permease [Hymenobacter arizonensis]SFQ18818.1 peptide/nickel transport system permease protein [Hymenobacter arizonensis]
MAWSLLWRFSRTLLAVWALASVVFLLSHHDTDTAAQFALSDSSEFVGSGSSSDSAKYQAAQSAVLHRLGLDLPLFYVGRITFSPSGASQWQWHGFANQYHRWLTGVLKGDLGTSFRTGQTVSARLLQALAYTLPLTGTAAMLSVLAALGLAQRLAAGPWWQRPVRTLLVSLHALPLFVVALLLLLLFANPEVFAWFPTYGLDQPTTLTASPWARTATYVLHMVLPITALILTALPDLTLQLTASLTHELGSDYAATARAKGLSGSAVIRHHALRNALLPTLTQIAELLPALVAGALVVEVVFALPGMGRLLAEAAASRDYPVLVGGVLLTGAARLLALLLADLLYLWADPRIRWQP